MQIMKNNEKRKVLKNTENTGISDKYWYALLKNTKKSQKTQQQKRQTKLKQLKNTEAL